MASAPDRVVVWGAGGHGRVVADVARALGYRLVGFIDSDRGRLGTAVGGSGARVVASEDEFLELIRSDDDWRGIGVALGVGDNSARLRCLDRLGSAGVPALVHPSAIVSPSAAIGRGTVVLPGAVVNADATLGDAVIVNSGAVVEHDCSLGHGVHVSPNATLTGGVRVADLAWIGAGAVVIPGRQVGARAIVGAAAVVLRDVPAGVTVVGNPARQLPR